MSWVAYRESLTPLERKLDDVLFYQHFDKKHMWKILVSIAVKATLFQNQTHGRSDVEVVTSTQAKGKIGQTSPSRIFPLPKSNSEG